MNNISIPKGVNLNSILPAVVPPSDSSSEAEAVAVVVAASRKRRRTDEVHQPGTQTKRPRVLDLSLDEQILNHLNYLYRRHSKEMCFQRAGFPLGFWRAFNSKIADHLIAVKFEGDLLKFQCPHARIHLTSGDIVQLSPNNLIVEVNSPADVPAKKRIAMIWLWVCVLNHALESAKITHANWFEAISFLCTLTEQHSETREEISTISRDPLVVYEICSMLASLMDLHNRIPLASLSAEDRAIEHAWYSAFLTMLYQLDPGNPFLSDSDPERTALRA